MFITQPLEYAFGCMALLLGAVFVGQHNRIDNAGERIKLGPKWRLRTHISRRNRELQHLGNGSGIDPEPLRRRPCADTLNLNGESYSRV